MKHLYTLFYLFTTLLYSSCSESPNEINASSNLRQQDTVVSFFPEGYGKISADTFLDHRIRTVIIRETLMDEIVSDIYPIDSFTTAKNNYRDYMTTILIYHDSSLLFKRSFTKQDFEQIGDAESLSKAITHNTWIQDYDSLTKTIQYAHVIGVPETDWAYKFTLYVDSTGNYHSELDEIN